MVGKVVPTDQPVVHVQTDAAGAPQLKPEVVEEDKGAHPVDHNAAADKKMQKQLADKEKELQKKLAQHKMDPAEAADSEQSICIAPPPPSNKMSTVELLVLGVPGYRKILIGCAVLLLLAALTQFVVLFAVVTIWPMGFAAQFEITMPDLHKNVLLIMVVFCPLISLVWLIAVISCGRKGKICCFDNDTYCCIRVYYVYSPFLLIVPMIAFTTYILFIGRLDQEVLESVMINALNTYDALNKSRDAWDETQTHFKCCGVDRDGWRNWETRDMVREDVGEWKVPASCCKIKNITQCMYETNDDYVYNDGCQQKVFDVYALYGNLVVCTLIAVMLVSCISIYFCTRYYTALRRRQEPEFEFHVFTYVVECALCCRRCRPVDDFF